MLPQRAAAPILVLATVLGGSLLAYAQLGGSAGVRIPYQGLLEVDGQPANGTYDFDFHLFNAASGGSACAIHEDTILVSAGRFSTVIGPVTPACVRGVDVFVQASVSADRAVTTPEAIGDRQQLFAAVAATTSGSGDFHIEGAVAVDGIATFNDRVQINDNVDMTGNLDAASLSTTTLNATTVNASEIVLNGNNLANTIKARQIITDRPGGSTNFGNVPFTAGSSGNGLLLISASGYRTGSSGIHQLDVLLDNVVVETMTNYSNEASSHSTFTTYFIPVSGAPNAVHNVLVREGAGSSRIDSNDRLNIALIDTP